MERGGCYIFLSHSSKDIKIVRKIRNEFEFLGHNPIAFHLRCLDENYPKRDDELWNLIYREIDAREWFVYCKSTETENNKNVQRELAYMKRTGKRKRWEIDITKDWNTIKNEIYKIVTDMEVFISYSHKDIVIAQMIKKVLIEADYSVWIDEDNLKSGDNFLQQINNAIERCAKKGFYIIVVSKNSLESKYMEIELRHAVNQGAWIVPVVVGKLEMPAWLRALNVQCYECPEQPTEADFFALLHEIDNVMLKKIHALNNNGIIE